MTMMKRPMIAALLAAALAAPALAQQPGGMMGGGGPGWMQDGDGPGWMRGGRGPGWMHDDEGWGRMMRGGPGGMMMGDPAGRMTGRLAFLEAELGITGEQQDEWDAFASAAREAAEGMRPMHEMMWSREERPSFPERLDLMDQLMQGRLDAMRSVHEEARALYETLDPEQRETADQLMGMGMM